MTSVTDVLPITLVSPPWVASHVTVTQMVVCSQDHVILTVGSAPAERVCPVGGVTNVRLDHLVPVVPSTVIVSTVSVMASLGGVGGAVGGTRQQ